MSIKATASSQGLERTTNLPNGNSAYTMMVWARKTSDAANYQCVLNIDSGNATGDTYYLRSSGTNQCAIWVNNGNGVQGSAFDNTRWHHFTLVRESATRVLGYLDGVLDITGPTTNVGSRAATSRMDVGQAKGAGGSGEDLQSGAFEYVRVWNRALTQHEIVREMRSRRAVSRQGLLTEIDAFNTNIVDRSGYTGWAVSGSPGIAEHVQQYLPWPRRKPVLYIASGGQTISVGLVTETDSALAMTWKKVKAIGLTTETDSALAMAAKKAKAIGLTTETDSALAMTWKKIRAIGLISETDSALAMTWKKVMAIGLASETDSALGITSGDAIAVGQASETDSALAMTWRKLKAIGLISETDSALAMTRAKSKIIGLPSESDSAFTMAHRRIYALGQATETDQALNVTQAGVTPPTRSQRLRRWMYRGLLKLGGR